MPTLSEAALLETAEPTHQDREQAQKAMTALSQGHLEVGQLPDVARQLLSRILIELANGHALSVLPVESELTTSQAASFLNVSRPYLSRLLDQGKLPFHTAGTHKRVRLRDLKAYRERQDAESYAALAELQAQAQELNMGY
jgi:excisionase family DNA binding protein